MHHYLQKYVINMSDTVNCLTTGEVDAEECVTNYTIRVELQ